MKDPFEWESEHILNHMFRDLDDQHDRNWQAEVMAMHLASSREGGAVKFLKARLGRQKFTWQGSSRNWVWEGANWRAFASREGVSFEVRSGLSTEQAYVAWYDFRSKAGLT